MSRFYQNI